MKSTLLSIVAFLCLTCSFWSYADTTEIALGTKLLQVDFGVGQGLNGWNEVSQKDQGTLIDLVDINGQTLDAKLEVSGFNSTYASSDGTQTPKVDLDLPVEATQDALFGHPELFKNEILPKGIVTLSGLDPTKQYDLTLFSSRLDSQYNRETHLVVTGDSVYTEAEVDTHTNHSEAVISYGITPNSAGEILIEASPGDDNDQRYNMFYLNAITLYESLDPSINNLGIKTDFGDIQPTYNPDWQYKVTNHTADNHLSCDLNDTASFGCDYVVTPDFYYGRIFMKENLRQLDPQPGEKVCVAPGTYNDLGVFRIHGTEEEPITVTNCGGQVVIEGSIDTRFSSNIKILGNGSTDHTYGFEARAASMTNLSRDIELAWVDLRGIEIPDDATEEEIEELTKNSGATLHFNSGKATDDNGDFIYLTDPVTEELFVQTGSHIHHNLIRNSYDAEGLYIGIFACEQDALDSGRELQKTYVYDNIIKDHGGDGMQVGCSTEDTLIFNNYISNVGYNPFQPYAGHVMGIQLGAGTSGYVFNNYIEDAVGAGVFIQSWPTNVENRDVALSVFNNIVRDSGHAVMFNAYTNAVVDSNQRFLVEHNTFVNITNSHYFIGYNFDGILNVDFNNNLYVNELGVSNFSGNPNKLSFNEQGRMEFYVLENAGFVDPDNGNFNLQTSSPAVGAGVDVSVSDAILDMNGNARTTSFDVGALQFTH